MPDTTNEAFYDNEVAPVLLALAKACEERGMGLLALVEYAPDAIGRTLTKPAYVGEAFRMPVVAAYSGGNLDSFLLATERHARQHGHSSAYLARLGVPTTPKPTTPDA